MSPRHGKMRVSRKFRGALMEKKAVKAGLGLGVFVLFVALFLLNQITSTSIPTSVYTPGPRQPLAVPRSPSSRPHPHPGVSATLGRTPTFGVPAPRGSSPQHATRYGTRGPIRSHRPTTHHPRPPTHHPRPPKPPTTPPKSPTPPPGVLCRLLGICLNRLSDLGVWILK